MTVAITAAHGASLKIGDGATSEVFTEIDGVHNGPNGPQFRNRIIEAAHHGTTSVIKRASLRDNGTLTFDLYYDSNDTQHALCLSNCIAKTVTNFQLLLTDTGAEQYAFAAIIEEMSQSADVEGFNVYSVTLSISGDITVS